MWESVTFTFRPFLFIYIYIFSHILSYFAVLHMLPCSASHSTKFLFGLKKTLRHVAKVGDQNLCLKLMLVFTRGRQLTTHLCKTGCLCNHQPVKRRCVLQWRWRMWSVFDSQECCVDFLVWEPPSPHFNSNFRVFIFFQLYFTFVTK